MLSDTSCKMLPTAPRRRGHHVTPKLMMHGAVTHALARYDCIQEAQPRRERALRTRNVTNIEAISNMNNIIYLVSYRCLRALQFLWAMYKLGHAISNSLVAMVFHLTRLSVLFVRPLYESRGVFNELV